MKPEHFEFGGGATETRLHPVSLVAMLLAIGLVLWLPRKRVAVPFLLTLFLVPMGQQIYIAGLHWLVLRVVILAGCLRLVVSKFQRHEEILKGGMNTLDKVVILWALYRGFAPIILFHVSGAVPIQIALWIQTLGGYFVLRYLIQDEEDITRVAKTFAVLAVIFGVCMLSEHVLDRNVFGYISPGLLIPQRRDGQIRAQASFGHPILAGCFGATLVPLFFWLWKSGKSKPAAVYGVIGSGFMVLASASSTPVLAIAGAIGALFLWPVRRFMRMVRWGIVLMLAVLAMVMKAPVWFVIQYMSVVGSGGYDRAALIDVFLRHFSDWWLIGTDKTGDWGFDMWDLSNQFAAEGETGGLLCFICFIVLITKCFSWLGKTRSRAEGDKKQAWLCWSLCAVMFAHVLSFFGVSYWDQTIVWWTAFLAMVSVATDSLRNVPVKVKGSLTQNISPLESEGWLWHPALHSSNTWPAEPETGNLA
jgi:hypothetical protein